MYEMTSEERELPGVGAYRTYGVRSSGGQAFRDISTEKGRVGRWIALLNQLRASELHLRELLEDFLQ